MANSVNQIINRALQLIRAESLYQDENQDARCYILERLNDILAEMNGTGFLIPFQSTVEFTLTAGKPTYNVGTAESADIKTEYAPVAIDYVNILIDEFSYPVEIVDQFYILNNVTTNTYEGRPRAVLLTPQDEYTTFRFYGVPERDYACQVLQKSTLSSVSYQTDISQLPAMYRQFLIYELARRSNIEQGIGTWTELADEEYKRSYQTIKNSTARDFRVRSRPPFSHYQGEYTQYLGVTRG